jgi:hypothetical protein
MKSASVLAIVAAAAITLSSPVLAQLELDLGAGMDASGSAAADDTTGSVGANASGNASVDDEGASADVILAYDINGDGSLSVEELAAVTAALEAAGNAGFSVDANGDGRLDAEEAAALTAALSGSASVEDIFDTDDDGIISPDEQGAAIALLASGDFDCSASGLEPVIALTATFDAAALAAATKANVVVIANCDAANITAALAAEGATTARSTLDDNPVVLAAVQAQGYQMDDVLGATVTGGTVTVYVVTAQA